MRLKLLAWWQLLHRSYWFIPGLMSIGALVLAVAMVYLDNRIVASGAEPIRFLPQSDAAGGRAILSTIAGSAITVAGVVFSITIVILSTAAAQFGPGLLPNFMNQNGTQIVLGGFIATFIYSLLILAHIQESEDPAVPQYALSLGLALGIFSFGLLIFFIHYVAMFIQVPRILANVEADLKRSIRGSFPDTPDSNAGDDEWPQDFDANSVDVESRSTGYLQAIDYQALLEEAVCHDLRIQTHMVAGHYVLAGQTLMQICAARPVGEDVISGLRAFYMINEERTSSQDPVFAVDQIVEIALRALSPGINDPFTAVQCVNMLGNVLVCLAGRYEPQPLLFDKQGRVRLRRRVYTYEKVIDKAFNQLRQYGAGHAAVAVRLMELMADLACLELPDNFRACLQHHAELLAEDTRTMLRNTADVEDFDRYYQIFSNNAQSCRV